MKLYEITKTFTDLVWAPDDDDAFEVFNDHLQDINDDAQIVEIKSLDDLRRLGYDEQHIPWGHNREDKTAKQLLQALAREAWEKRVAVAIVDPSDVGTNVEGIDTEITAADVGRVVYRLPDGRLVAEHETERAERRLAKSDREVALEIEVAKLKALATELNRRLGAL